MNPTATRCAVALVALMAALVLGCSKPPTPSQQPSQPSAQTFNFAAQPIAFVPPSAPWEAEGEQSGGLRGVRYVKRLSVGEAIGVANYHDVSRRLRHDEIGRLRTVNSDYESAEFDHAVRQAWCYTDNPYADLEAEVATDVNAALNRAVAARKARDYDTVRAELVAAQEAADRLHFAFNDVIERAMFDPEKTLNPARYKFIARRDSTIAGEPALVVDYTLDLPEGRRYLRKAYVMYNDHLFVADFIGLEGSLPSFDRVVASISFPP